MWEWLTFMADHHPVLLFLLAAIGAQALYAVAIALRGPQ